MSSSWKNEFSLKYQSLTDCLVDLMSSTCNDKRTSAIKLHMNFHKGCFQFVCEGMVLSKSEMKLISNCSQVETKKLMNVLKDAFLNTLSRIAVHCKKFVIVTTKKKRRKAYKMVFQNGVRTGIGFITAKNRVSTIIKVYELINVPKRSGDMGSYEYCVLKNHLKALALTYYSIPIDISEKKYGNIIKWPGKFTGLGSSFSALVQSDTNIILPVHAKFHNVRMEAFIALDFHPDRSHQYVYLNNKFVRWKYLYTLFYRILGKAFEVDTENRNNFKFVLCIDCPNEYCQIHHSFFTPEVRLRELKPIVSCFNILFSNIEMMYKCKKWCQYNRWIVQKSENLSSKECFKGSQNKLILILDYSWELDFETLIEPFIFMKNKQNLNVIRVDKYLYHMLLTVKNEFGSYRFTLNDEKLKISPTALLQLVAFLFNAWIDNPARRNEYFNFLKETISSVCNMSNLEIIKALLKSNESSKCDPILELKIGQSNVAHLSFSYDEDYMLKPCCSGCGKGGNAQVLDSERVSLFYLRQPTIENIPQNFSTVGRNSYPPKGTSPMAAKIENIAVYSECRNGMITTDIIKKCLAVNRNIGFSKKPTIQNLDGEIRTIPKDLFGNMKVIGQFDSKFIICELKQQQKPHETGLIMFDQHGIDERIRLEDLSNNSFDGGTLPKFYLKNWILLRLENEELALLLQFTNYFSKFGIDINSISSGTLIVQSIPEILHRLGGYWTKSASSYINYLFEVLKEIFEEQMKSIKCSGNTTNIIPSILHKQMCKTACSSAIKFGQNLSLMECCRLVDKLSKCNVPFLCAHGRPTAFFVGGMKLNDESPTPPNLDALKKVNI